MKRQETTDISAAEVLGCVNARLRMLSRRVNKIYLRELKPLGISSGQQLTVLFMIGKIGTISQHELGKLLFLQRSTVSRELEGLVRKGFIRKSNDTKSPEISMTELGSAFVKSALPKWARAQEKVMQLIGAAGSHSLDALLEAVKV